MSHSVNQQLPDYAAPDAKSELLAAGASGTIYSLVMPESEAALIALVGDREGLLDRYREPWTQKQDAMHQAYFDTWMEWASPIVRFDAAAFPFRYPTAGASEGIFKLMAEYLARSSAPNIHIFDGEYEGFPAYAEALGIRCVRHDRSDWQAGAGAIGRGGLFWISQPSAIDGQVWPQFEPFVARLAAERPDVAIIPDLTYVGAVAREFSVTLDSPNIPAFEISVLPPSRTQPSPARRAEVESAATSDPAPGSVMAKAVITSPAAIGPSQRSRCAGVPASSSGVVPSPWRANTASASGDTSPSISRARQQARRSSSNTGRYGGVLA